MDAIYVEEQIVSIWYEGSYIIGRKTLIIGERIKLLRKAKKLTQTELAKAIFVSYQLVSKWERNLSEPTAEMMFTIIDKYQLPFDFFLDPVTQQTQYTAKEVILNAFLESMIASYDKRPTIKKVAQVASLEPEHVALYFANSDELIYEFFNEVDRNIKIEIEAQIVSHHDLITIFINNMAPLLYDKRVQLHVLYTRPYIKGIWLAFIKSKYKRILLAHHQVDKQEGLALEYLIEVLTAFISVWLSQPNPEPLAAFQNRMRCLTGRPINQWL
ncbi:MAG TPA: DNA-binding protein [Leuconostoc pseudomesenteroides]|nr:DNA-binding protein [Leuconostoc pseudomesenteroides]